MAERELVHSGIVRATHWLVAISFVGLIVSGTAILIAHPRFYWGETGAYSTPAWLDLRLDPVYDHTGWGRSLHFQSAWVFALSGMLYIAAGLVGRHFRSDLLPSRAELSSRAVASALRQRFLRRGDAPASQRYNVVQKLSYLVVIFVLCPAMIWTGLAMSPALSAQYPFLATALGGHQSARTVHFLVANLLVLFLVVHVTMLALAGFGTRTRAMVTGHRRSSEGSA
jgi:thiosulfate reductase cytochrome b subunit